MAKEGEPNHPSQLERKVPESNSYERHRLIAHLGRTFARRYDMDVLPSGQKGVWACGLDPKITPEIEKYIEGERKTLDDLPPESFVPQQILYDDQAAAEMSMEQITTILHHEAGHAKYTDFRLMFDGQKQAKDEGYMPTSFWLTFEGLEDPRVNTLEGEESPAIDRQIRTNQGRDLQQRITESPLSQRPQLLQFAYNSFHYWLHGEGIPELAGTDVGKLTEQAKPLIEQYFQNTDLEQRRLLQKQIWEIVKPLEKKDIEQEEMRQMAQKQKGQQGQGQSGQQGSGEGQPQPGQGQGQESSGQSGGLPGKSSSGGGQESSRSQNGRKKFLDRLKESILGKGSQPQSEQQNKQPEAESKPSAKTKQEKVDLSKLSQQELQQLKDAIDQLSSEEKAELLKKAKETVDEAQKEELEKRMSKMLKLHKNKKTGEYEAAPQTANEKTKQQAKAEYQQAVDEVEVEEKAQWEKEEAERKQQEEIIRQQEAARREKLDMEKAGFDEDEREKFLLYQSLENSMYSYVRNFRQAIEKVIPRRKEPVYESGFFSGPKFDRRDLIRRAPIGDERFHMRQVDRPTGEPRLFIGLLVDNSGSMEGTKMQEARKTMIFFARVCKEMGIPFMGTAFGSSANVIKSFRQDFDNPSERIKPGIIDATDASGGGTNLYDGVKVTIEAMNEQRRRLSDSHGLIFVITDGGANQGMVGENLRSYIEENRGRLTFKSFGLSDGAGERQSIQNQLNFYFGESNCAYPEGFEDLPDEAFRVLRVNLMQFQKYFA